KAGKDSQRIPLEERTNPVVAERRLRAGRFAPEEEIVGGRGLATDRERSGKALQRLLALLELPPAMDQRVHHTQHVEGGARHMVETVLAQGQMRELDLGWLCRGQSCHQGTPFVSPYSIRRSVWHRHESVSEHRSVLFAVLSGESLDLPLGHPDGLLHL